MIKKARKVEVKKVLGAKKEKEIFIPDLNKPIKKNFNLILSESSGEYNLDIKIRDSRGRVVSKKTLTFRPGKSLDLLSEASEKDLMQSRELQLAINRNLLKYVEVEPEVKQFEYKPQVKFENRVKSPEETSILPTIRGDAQAGPSSVNLNSNTSGQINSRVLIPADNSLKLIGETYFSFDVFPALDPGEVAPSSFKASDRYLKWSSIEDGYRIPIRIPLITNKEFSLRKESQLKILRKNINLIKTEQPSSSLTNLNLESEFDFELNKTDNLALTKKISFKILSGDKSIHSIYQSLWVSTGENIQPKFLILEDPNRPDFYYNYLEMYLIYDLGAFDGWGVNDLGKTFKIVIEATIKNGDGSLSKAEKLYTISTNPQSPLIPGTEYREGRR